MEFVTETVESFPDTLQPGVLYISSLFSAATHLCPCGCRYEVYTPIGPEGWTLTMDGSTATLEPSMANTFPCQSHYWIRNNIVIWA